MSNDTEYFTRLFCKVVSDLMYSWFLQTPETYKHGIVDPYLLFKQFDLVVKVLAFEPSVCCRPASSALVHRHCGGHGF